MNNLHQETKLINKNLDLMHISKVSSEDSSTPIGTSDDSISSSSSSKANDFTKYKDTNETASEFSADIKPLQFTMKRSPINNTFERNAAIESQRLKQHSNTAPSLTSFPISSINNSSDNSTRPSYMTDDATKISSSSTGTLSSASRSRAKTTTASNNIHGRTGTSKPNNISNPLCCANYSFNAIDQDQFEKYLKEPHYIKLLNKRKSFKIFRRLFLAQELKAFDDENRITGFPANSHADSSKVINNIPLHSPPITPTSSSTNLTQPSDRAIWITKFSLDGKFMVTTGKSGIIRIWKVLNSPVERWELNSSIDSNNSARVKALRLRNNLNPSPSLSPNHSGPMGGNNNSSSTKYNGTTMDPSLDNLTHSLNDSITKNNGTMNLYAPVFNPICYKMFKEHKSDVLDLDWSKNNFLVTASMDKTVKLWHIDRATSLRTFRHQDFVTCVAFHPIDDRFIISGCLDHKCRLWSILDNEVSFEFDCHDLITSLTLSPEDGKYTIVGTFNGYIHILLTKGLQHVSSFHVTDKTTQVENLKNTPISIYKNHKIQHGPKITGLESFRAKIDNSLRLIVTTNDSKIRIFDVKSRKMMELLKGFHSGSSQHRAQLALHHNQPVVMSSSDDHWAYGWKLKSSSVTVNESGRFSSNALSPQLSHNNTNGTAPARGTIIRSASLKNLFSRPLTKTLSQNSNDDKQSIPAPSSHNHLTLTSFLSHYGHHEKLIKNSECISFHASHAPVTSFTSAPSGTAKTLSLSNDFICELSTEFYEDTNDYEFDDDYITHKRSGNKNNNSNIINVVKAIGPIMVTTDNAGTIRVFRTDISNKIRRRVLKKLQEDKLQQSLQLSLQKNHSVKSMMRLPLTSSSVNTPHSNLRPSPLSDASALHTGTNKKGKRSCPVIRSKSSATISAMALTSTRGGSLSRRALTNQAPFKRNSSYNNVTSDSNNDSNNSTYPGHPETSPSNLELKCDICHGSNFEILSERSENTYYCTDCGTVLNNFR
ncbi:Laf1p NDAI_0H02330 [Naumovozyma dairenensis CBS 421]|uniref:Uncharacterized protein n=1 Tax=Naumovozyma dairenensis (strain ATCC 10597 / BCRC 20456 / CBS 421 / NBRC 0211 / NRRL Y-12639) TaxID=1071378 RepID=G0WF46_NAUDC|nr:hypothetical protein NDAI_0H02330 [Naumovozyma dairenensis CBS 421]CCD26407.1 hypothetical protein NDAI_0H02330 [Naumovozyma dairenensis CBS 421]